MPKKPFQEDVQERRTFLKVALSGATLMATGTAAPSSHSELRLNSPVESGSDQDIYDVVIIGAGLAGLTAARDIQGAGNESFVVLEARDRVGGRVLNHQLSNGYISEAGGQWMGPGQTAVADLARELSVATFKSDYQGKTVVTLGSGKVELDLDGGTGLDEEVVAKIEALAKTVPSASPWTAPQAKQLDEMSFAEWLDKQGSDHLESQVWSLSSLMAGGTGASKLSFLYYLSMFNSAGSVQALLGQKQGAQETRFVGGSQILASKIADSLGKKIRLSSPVVSISSWNEEVVGVHLSKAILRTRRVILALSPPLCQRIQFQPALPSDRRELQQRWPAHGPLCKTVAVYPKPFWREIGYNAQISNIDGPILWSYDNSPQDSSIGIINAFVRVAELPDNKKQAQALIAKQYAEAMNDNRLLQPIEFHMHDWGAEPYTISCVSPMPPGLLTSGLMPALKKNIGALIWSGTETADIWNGYMDGAVRSGHKAALQALQGLPRRALV